MRSPRLLALSLTVLALACAAAPGAREESGDPPASSRDVRPRGVREWSDLFAAFDGTSHARSAVEPMLEVAPELRHMLERDFRASHGTPGGEAPRGHHGAVVRYSRYPGAKNVEPQTLDREDEAELRGDLDSLAFYALYDSSGHLTHLVEIDAWLSGMVESERRVEWRDDRPIYYEWSAPYADSRSTARLEWDEAGRLLRIERESTKRGSSSLVLEYEAGSLRRARAFEDGTPCGEVIVERDPEGRIRHVERRSFGWVSARWGGDRALYYHRLERDQVQRVRLERDGWSGVHWMRTADGVERTCSFRPARRDGVDGLYLSRTEYHETMRRVQHGFVPTGDALDPAVAVDAALLFDSPLPAPEPRPLGQFLPERPPGPEGTLRDGFVLERDARGNWLKVGRWNSKTGEMYVTHERTIEYR